MSAATAEVVDAWAAAVERLDVEKARYQAAFAASFLPDVRLAESIALGSQTSGTFERSTSGVPRIRIA
jgi:hypothetical protein